MVQHFEWLFMAITFICIIHNHQVLANIGKHLAKLKKEAPTSEKERLQWKENSCHKLKTLLHSKELAIQKLDAAMLAKRVNKRMSKHEKEFQIETLILFQKELNDSEDLIWHSVAWLRRTLEGDYKDLMNMKESSHARLEALRDATLKEEQEYNAILEAEKHKKAPVEPEQQSNIQGVLKSLLDEVAKAADAMEEKREDHVFEDAVHNPKFGHGANIEAVVKLEDDANEGPPNDDMPAIAVRLVDARDNQFVLSRGEDTTVPHADHHYIKDIMYLLLLAFPLGMLCNMVKLPAMFGYIVSGVILGPSGFGILRSLVQIESLGEFGVFFILFTVGLEFSPAHLKQVFKVAVLGCMLQAVVMVICGVILGSIIQVSLKESAFVAACLSLSSTPLVVKFLSDRDLEAHGESDYGTVLLGILVMQDTFLGLLVVLLPLIAGHSTHKNEDFFHVVKIVVKLILSLCATLGLTIVMSFIVAKFYHHVAKFPREILVLSTVSVAFVLLLVTDRLGISMELGCFLAGAAISGQGTAISHEIEKLINPIKDLFACIFFVSIGLHVFPSFLAYELTTLTTLTFVVTAFKFSVGVLVLGLVLSPNHKHIKWVVAAGLSQVSEFSFVLGSRARRLDLISREVYLLILSVTTLSLLLAPVVWRVSIWRHGHLKT